MNTCLDKCLQNTIFCMPTKYNLATIAHDYFKVIFNMGPSQRSQLMRGILQDKRRRDILCVSLTEREMEMNGALGTCSWRGSGPMCPVSEKRVIVAYRNPGPPAKLAWAPGDLVGEDRHNPRPPRLPISPRRCSIALRSLAMCQGHWGGLGL